MTVAGFLDSLFDIEQGSGEVSVKTFRMTRTTLVVLDAFMLNVGRPLCGADIEGMTRIGAGTRYPILYRLEAAGWLASRWEDLDPSEVGRPRRRYYQLTEQGQEWARSVLGEMRGRLAWET